MSKIDSVIKIFVSKVKELYPDLKIEIDYDSVGDRYEIWHDNMLLELEDKEYSSNIGRLIREVYNQGIYNFDFGYDPFKTVESKVNNYISSYEINISLPLKEKSFDILQHPMVIGKKTIAANNIAFKSFAMCNYDIVNDRAKQLNDLTEAA